MNIEKLLEYQNLDSELVKVEKQMKENKDKESADQMMDTMKKAQARSVKLEEKAQSLLAEVDKVKKQYEIQESKMKEFLDKDLSSLSKEELEKLCLLKDKLSQNLSILEKNLSSLAETVNGVLADFNKTIKLFNTSKDEYLSSKTKYENVLKTLEVEKADLEKKLKVLEKNVDGELMAKYKKRRAENIFPIVVCLNGNSCGGCHVELSYAIISKLNNEGMLSCEHCHRIIYKK